MSEQCKNCNDTGCAPGSFDLDCSAMGCNAATERAALDAFERTLPSGQSMMDDRWSIYRHGKEVQRKADAARIAHLTEELGIARKAFVHLEEISISRDKLRETISDMLTEAFKRGADEGIAASIKSLQARGFLPEVK